MYELKKIGKVFTSKFVGTGPSSYKKRIYRAAVSQRLRNTGIDDKPFLVFSGSKNVEDIKIKKKKETIKLENVHFSGLYRVSQEDYARLREGVPYVKVYRYNPKHIGPKLNGYGDNGQRSLKL